MNADDPNIRPTEMAASPLESFGGQRIPTDTFTKARELRRWIHQNPGKRQCDAPAELRNFFCFLQSKGLIYWKRIDGKAAYFVKIK